MLNIANREALRENFSGEIILPSDGHYQQASTVYAAVGSPAIVLRPRTNTDVVTAVNYARDSKLVLSVRSGGHHVVGFGTNKDGVVIDLSAMNKIEVVAGSKGLVRIGAGALWGEVAKTLQPHHLALSSGDTVSVGVGGLTLGGGIGWMVRKYGLAIDSLVGAEVVTADGNILRASESENADLFWAIRGGGGNFGVVTEFEFAAHPLGKVLAGAIGYPLANLAELLKGWRDYMRTAPEELSTSVTIMPAFGPENPPMALVMTCYAGTGEAAEKATAPLHHFGTVLWQNVMEKEYADVLEEAHPPEGVKAGVNNMFAKTFGDELVEAVVATTREPGMRVFQIRGLGGAMSRVAPEATAFSHRDAEIMMFMAAFLPVAAPDEAMLEAMKLWNTLTPFGTGGAYAGFISTNTEADLYSVYPTSTYERLARVKKVYDPGNLFNQNYNIKPAN